MKKDEKIYIAGYKGLVGSAVKRKLEEKQYANLIYSDAGDFDLQRQQEVEHFFERERPGYVFLAAARVGGIWANKSYPAEFIYNNISIQTNIIHAAYKYGVKKLLFLGSSCIYPRLAPQPMKEEHLLTSPLEPTNEAYAIAKIAGLKMCRYYNEQYGTDFISVMPTNLYGPNDNYNLQTSHVLPALIRKFHEAKVNNTSYVELWGTGSPRREFLYVDDLADAVVFLVENYGFKDIGEIINIGTGEDISIKELAQLIREVINFTGDLRWDTTKPDGTPQKLLDVSRLRALGWKHGYSLEEGIKKTYEAYLSGEMKK
ncbi:MAG: GDP-L-fucose synthase [Acidobacteria bacterium]|jgi:GDP-L-fucose synthase|nr:GDP-L-fucose synthase [Acidobacteriota bacterium]